MTWHPSHRWTGGLWDPKKRVCKDCGAENASVKGRTPCVKPGESA